MFLGKSGEQDSPTDRTRRAGAYVRRTTMLGAQSVLEPSDVATE